MVEQSVLVNVDDAWRALQLEMTAKRLEKCARGSHEHKATMLEAIDLLRETARLTCPVLFPGE